MSPLDDEPDEAPGLDVEGFLALLSYAAAAVTIALTVAALIASPIAWWVL